MFTKAYFALLSFMLPVMVMAQAGTNGLSINQKQEIIVKPRFKGNLERYIVRNIKYPQQARENGIQGKCVVEFMVDEKGGIQRIAHLKSSGNEVLDAEAQRIVASMPAWRPGSFNKQPAAYYYSLPINFELQ